MIIGRSQKQPWNERVMGPLVLAEDGCDLSTRIMAQYADRFMRAEVGHKIEFYMIGQPHVPFEAEVMEVF